MPQNAMELDMAVRNKLPLVGIITLNGGWTADPERNKPVRDTGAPVEPKVHVPIILHAAALGCLDRNEDAKGVVHRLLDPQPASPSPP